MQPWGWFQLAGQPELRQKQPPGFACSEASPPPRGLPRYSRAAFPGVGDRSKLTSIESKHEKIEDTGSRADRPGGHGSWCPRPRNFPATARSRPGDANLYHRRPVGDGRDRNGLLGWLRLHFHTKCDQPSQPLTTPQATDLVQVAQWVLAAIPTS
jgi:hypothetical protein